VSSPGWKRALALPDAVRLVWHESEPHPRDVAIADLYTDLTFPPPSAGLPYLVANMVMTQNGEAAVDGKAATIGTRVDGLVLTRLRVATDAVLTGVGTIVAEDVTAVLPEAEAARRAASGRPPRLLVAVLASRLAWAPEVLSRRLFTDPRFDRLVICGDGAPAEDVRRVEAHGVEVTRVASASDGRPDPAAALRALGTRGVRSLVSEGGPRVLASLFRARLTREYFLTTSPFAIGGDDAPRPLAADVGGPVLLSRISRIEQAFADPTTGAPLVESYDRFRVVYPEATPGAGANP